MPSIPRIPGNGNVNFSFSNKNNFDVVMDVEFVESGPVGTWQTYGRVNDIKVSASTTYSATINNEINVEMKGYDQKTVELASTEKLGGILTFTPDKSDGTQGEIKSSSGDNTIKYNVMDATWTGGSWNATNNSTIHLIINPDSQKLAPGSYSGSMSVKLEIP